MWVVLTDHIPYDTGGFLIRTAVREVEFIHGKEDTSMHRLEPITCIRKRTTDNNTHRIVKITSLDTILYQYLLGIFILFGFK